MDAKWISFFLLLLAALIHFFFFTIEAYFIRKPGAAKALGYSAETHKHIKLWAINQSVYNLSLSIGTLIGLNFVLQKQIMLAGVLTGFCGSVMILAGITLALTAPRLWKWAVVQALPPALGFIFLFFHITDYTG